MPVQQNIIRIINMLMPVQKTGSCGPRPVCWTPASSAGRPSSPPCPPAASGTPATACSTPTSTSARYETIYYLWGAKLILLPRIRLEALSGLIRRSRRKLMLEGDPTGWSTVLITALGIWEKSVSRGHCYIIYNKVVPDTPATACTTLTSTSARYETIYYLLLLEGDPTGWSTVLITALGSWEKSVSRGHCYILYNKAVSDTPCLLYYIIRQCNCMYHSDEHFSAVRKHSVDMLLEYNKAVRLHVPLRRALPCGTKT
jgi:hypothetical protein